MRLSKVFSNNRDRILLKKCQKKFENSQKLAKPDTNRHKQSRVTIAHSIGICEGAD